MIDTTQFKQLLARTAKVSDDEASAFVDAMVSLILEHIAKGEEVTVGGLGTFHVIEAQQGELRRLAFSPDEKIREAVNAPFSCFEPFVIAEAEPKKTLPEEVVTPVMTEEKLPEEVVAPAMTEEKLPEEVVTPAMTEEKLQEEVNTPAKPEKKLPEHDSRGAKRLAAIILTVCILAVGATMLWWTVCHTDKVSEEVAAQAVQADKDSTASAATQPQLAEVPTEPAQTAPQPAAPVKPQPPTREQLLLDEDGEPRMAILTDGERLTLLALSVYGDKTFWCYIYDVNAFQLGDPNNVPKNVPLYLPNPDYYRIESDDEVSLRRARNRAAKILNQYSKQ
ncbi:MAG: HU family DNA-binding protein [Bacteroidales bacterium]|nr:HU family DNA-binding protein [Candidatus Liminaster caballi]